jgi:hypothetical protein
MNDHKLLHDATLIKETALDALHFTVESWHCLTHMRIVNCFLKCGFNLNYSNDGEDTTKQHSQK